MNAKHLFTSHSKVPASKPLVNQRLNLNVGIVKTRASGKASGRAFTKSPSKYWGQLVRYHLFVAITLIGCIIPSITPRYFPVRGLPSIRYYGKLKGDPVPPLKAWIGKTIVQNAC